MDKKIAENVEIVEIKTDFIKLDQLLKWTNLTGSGSEAKMFILNGDVKVNGEVELRRGKKIHEGDIVEFNGEKIAVKVQKQAALRILLEEKNFLIIKRGKNVFKSDKF